MNVCVFVFVYVVASRFDLSWEGCAGFGLQFFGRNSEREFAESNGTGDNQLFVWFEESYFVRKLDCRILVHCGKYVCTLCSIIVILISEKYNYDKNSSWC